MSCIQFAKAGAQAYNLTVCSLIELKINFVKAHDKPVFELKALNLISHHDWDTSSSPSWVWVDHIHHHLAEIFGGLHFSTPPDGKTLLSSGESWTLYTFTPNCPKKVKSRWNRFCSTVIPGFRDEMSAHTVLGPKKHGLICTRWDQTVLEHQRWIWI